MESRSSKVVAIVALVVAVIGLGIGFAAFSSTLTISSSATVTPSASTFKVAFSTSSASLTGTSITPTTTGGATAEASSFTETTLTGSDAQFTAPGQSVKYSLYAYNAGEYLAYLNGVTVGAVTCEPGEGTTAGLVNAACDDITVSVKVGNTTYTESDSAISSHTLAKGTGEPVEVLISYAENGDRADGVFTVSIGSISLVYDSHD